MSIPFAQIFNDALDKLERTVKSLDKPGDLDGLAGAYFRGPENESTLRWLGYQDPSMWLSEADVDLSQAPQLAILGFLIDVQLRKGIQLSASVVEEFRSYADILKLRQNVFALPNSWVLQPHVLLGVSAGIKAIEDPSLRDWLEDLVGEACKKLNNPPLLQLIYLYIAGVLARLPSQATKLPMSLELVQYSLPELALGVLLVKRDLLLAPIEDRSEWLRTACSAIIAKFLKGYIYQVEDFKAVIIWDVVQDYIERWANAVVYVDQNLLVSKSTEAQSLFDPKIPVPENVNNVQIQLEQSRKQNAFLIRLSLWLACVGVVFGVSSWIPESQALWISSSFILIAFGILVFGSWLFGRAWFYRPARAIALYLISVSIIIAVSWAILDSTLWETVIISVIIGGAYTLAQVIGGD